MSPLLLRLDQELRLAKDARGLAEIRTKQAGYYARTGDFVSAKSIVTDLRKEFGDGHSGRVTVWIMISEALIYHFENLNPVALDRITRAQFLSRLMNDQQLEALSSAWRANIEFDHSKFSEMFLSLRNALDKAVSTNSDALARISNIICKTAILCGADDLAKAHFKFGREHALREGDQAGIEAIQHNKAAFRVSRIRSMNCLGDIDPREVKEARVEIETAKSLQNLAGITALASYIDLCNARLLIIEGRLHEAIDRLKEIKNRDPYPAGSLSPEVLILEIAYCYAALGDFDDALRSLEGQNFEHLTQLDSDELLIVRWMQFKLAAKDQRFGDPESSKVLFDDAVSEYKEFVKRLQNGLSDLPSL